MTKRMGTPTYFACDLASGEESTFEITYSKRGEPYE